MAIVVTPFAAQVHDDNFGGEDIVFTGLNGSNFGAGKVVLVIVHNEGGSVPADVGVGASGSEVAMTKAGDEGSDDHIQIFYADVPEGTEDRVKWATGNGFDKVGVAGWHLAGAASGAPAATAGQEYGDFNDPQSATVTGSADGAITAAFGSVNGTTSTTQTTTWSANCEDTDGDFLDRINPGLIIGGAHSLGSGSQEITVEATGGDNFNFIGGVALAAWAATAAEQVPFSATHRQLPIRQQQDDYYE